MVSENGGVMEVVADMELRFNSGNSVPVDRAHITADQWRVIRAALVHGGGSNPHWFCEANGCACASNDGQGCPSFQCKLARGA